ncbi:MAG: 50S ribosomal protein L25 [Acidobacteria bacterium]|nr:50S ribosomal protein L25 [Acidobacteriota bacterium]
MEAVLEAVRRDTFGRNNAGRLRRQGRIPAVVYGGAAGKAESVSVDPKDLLRILHSESGANTIITFRLDGGDTRVVVKDYLLDPVKHELLHADFYRIAMDQVLTVTVPVHLVGEAKNAKAQGGTVDFVQREVVLEALPADIPEHISIDVTNMGLHDAIRVRDLETGGKWTPVSDADMMIVHIVAPRAAAEEAPAEGAATAAEPEVIKKGKTEKEEK